MESLPFHFPLKCTKPQNHNPYGLGQTHCKVHPTAPAFCWGQRKHTHKNQHCLCCDECRKCKCALYRLSPARSGPGRLDIIVHCTYTSIRRVHRLTIVGAGYSPKPYSHRLFSGLHSHPCRNRKIASKPRHKRPTFIVCTINSRSHKHTHEALNAGCIADAQRCNYRRMHSCVYALQWR